MNEDLKQYETIARALSDYSGGLKLWENRHPSDQLHWLLVAEALMGDDPTIINPIIDRVKVRKAELRALKAG